MCVLFIFSDVTFVMWLYISIYYILKEFKVKICVSFMEKNIIYWKLWLILTNQHYFVFSNINWHFSSIIFTTKYNSVFPKYVHLKIWIYEIICCHKSKSAIYYAFFLSFKYIYWFMLCNSSLLKWIFLYILNVGPLLFCLVSI